jgi:translocation and assembly module TamB
MPARRRVRRVLAGTLAVLGTVLVFVLAAAGGFLLHLNTTAARRMAAVEVNGALRTTFQGKLLIERVGRVGLHGLSGATVRVLDPSGAEVVYADGLEVKMDLPRALRSALLETGDIVVDVERVSIAFADVSLDADPAGKLRLETAFSTPPPAAPTEAGRALRLALGHVSLAHVRVHRALESGPPLVAEVRDLVGSVRVEPERAVIHVPSAIVSADGGPLPARGAGRLTSHVDIPAAAELKTTVVGRFDGQLGEVPATASVRLEGSRLEASADVRKTSGERIRALFEKAPLHGTFEAHAQAWGDLPRIQSVAHVVVGNGSVQARADLDLSKEPKIEAIVTARHIDVRSFAPRAPRSDLGANGVFSVSLPSGARPRVDAWIEVLPGRFGDTPLPPASIIGRARREGVTAIADVREPGAPLHAVFEMDDDGAVHVTARAEAPDFSKVPRLAAMAGGRAVHGRGGAELTGVVALDTSSLDAHATLTARDVVAGDVGAERIEATADVRGSLAEARVDVEADVVRRGVPVHLSVADLELDGGAFSTGDAKVEGLGEPIYIELRREPRVIHASARGAAIDLARVGRFAGIDHALHGGRVSLDGEVDLRGADAAARLALRAADVGAFGVEHGSLALDASVQDRCVDLVLDAVVADLGSLKLQSRRVELEKDPRDPEAWRRARGKLELDSSIDLGRAAQLLPRRLVPFGELRGTLSVRGRIGRESPDAAPEVRLATWTRGLVVAGRAAGTGSAGGVAMEAAEPWRSSGVDAQADLSVDGTTGFTALAARLVDAHGALFALDAKSLLPYPALIAGRGRLDGELSDAPLSAKLVVPRRAVAALPPAFGLQRIGGDLELDVDVSGTAAAPQVVASGHAYDLEVSRKIGLRSADLSAVYDGNHGGLQVGLVSPDGGSLKVTSAIDANARALLEGRGIPWSGDVRVVSRSFPIDALGEIVGTRIGGRVDGTVEITQLHEDARATARLTVKQPVIALGTYEHGALFVDAGDGRLRASAELRQKDGYLEVHGATELGWGASLTPEVDVKHVEAELLAKNFRIAALQPFVEDTLDTIDGRVDAVASAELDPDTRKPRLRGSVSLHDGLVHVSGLGGELRAIRAHATLDPSGEVRVERVSARGVTGELSGWGIAHLDGLSFVEGRGRLTVPRGAPFDLSLQGQPIGEIWGDFDLGAVNRPERREIEIRVDVPTLHAKLAASSKDLQELSENENIHAGVYRTPTRFVVLPLDREDYSRPKTETEGTTFAFLVSLHDVDVVRGNALHVQLTGNPRIELDGEPRVSGQLQLRGGTLDVQGKKFEIRKGTITFDGPDPSDPTVVVTAEWVAADKTQVFADFVGRAKTGKITLRSEPPRPQNEIVALVLFGTAEGASPRPAPAGSRPTTGSTPTTAAVGLGGGFVAEGLTEAVDDLTGIRAQARIDTTQANNPRPEIDFQIARNVSLQLSHVIGNPPISRPDKNYATIQWRIGRMWSLETTFGDRGRALVDAIWQKRY